MSRKKLLMALLLTALCIVCAGCTGRSSDPKDLTYGKWETVKYEINGEEYTKEEFAIHNKVDYAVTDHTLEFKEDKVRFTYSTLASDFNGYNSAFIDAKYEVDEFEDTDDIIIRGNKTILTGLQTTSANTMTYDEKNDQIYIEYRDGGNKCKEIYTHINSPVGLNYWNDDADIRQFYFNDDYTMDAYTAYEGGEDTLELEGNKYEYDKGIIKITYTEENLNKLTEKAIKPVTEFTFNPDLTIKGGGYKYGTSGSLGLDYSTATSEKLAGTKWECDKFTITFDKADEDSNEGAFIKNGKKTMTFFDMFGMDGVLDLAEDGMNVDETYYFTVDDALTELRIDYKDKEYILKRK